MFIGVSLLLLTKCLIAQTQIIKNNNMICIEDNSLSVSINNLQVCYVKNIHDCSILVWFTVGKSLNSTFDSYRFILRSVGNLVLTNFTKLVDFNNSLRLFNLDSGLYEVCIDLQSNSTTFIYQPRDGCISIQVGEASRGSFQHDSTSMMITLATGIVLFFILGLVVQWAKDKRRKKVQEEIKPRHRASSILSAITLREQRSQLAQHLFRRHIDQPRGSRMRQWARDRAFRHRISTPEQEFHQPRSFRRWSKNLFTSSEQTSRSQSRTGTISYSRKQSSAPIPTTNQIYTISEKEHYQISPRKPTFHLTPPEEYEMTSDFSNK